MGSTHSALHYHLIWGTKHLEPNILPAWRDRLQTYIGGCVRALDAVPLAIGGVSDHVHLLVSLNPTHRLSDFVRDVKRKSSEWIHTEISEKNFHWQEGYGVFSVSKSALEEVRKYVLGQEEHHRTRTFREEYVAFLERHGIECDERFLW